MQDSHERIFQWNCNKMHTIKHNILIFLWKSWYEDDELHSFFSRIFPVSFYIVNTQNWFSASLSFYLFKFGKWDVASFLILFFFFCYSRSLKCLEKRWFYFSESDYTANGNTSTTKQKKNQFVVSLLQKERLLVFLDVSSGSHNAEANSFTHSVWTVRQMHVWVYTALTVKGKFMLSTTHQLRDTHSHTRTHTHTCNRTRVLTHTFPAANFNR